MTKKSKKILISSLSLIAISSAIAIPLVVTNLKNTSKISSSDISSFSDRLISISETNPNDEYRYYLNKYPSQNATADEKLGYASYEQAFNGYISKYDPIKYNFYMGNPYQAIKDGEFNSIEITKLKKYDKDIYKKLSPAYINAFGTTEYDFSSAKATYGNAGGIQYWYSDFNGNLFVEKQDAINSIANSVESTPVMYYNLPGNKKFNPLNTEDLKNFKSDIYRTIADHFNNSSDINFPYGIKIYEYDPVNEKYSSLNSDIFSSNELVKSIINKILVSMYKGTLNYLKKEGKFDVALIMQTISDKDNKKEIGWDNSNYKVRWKIQNINNPKNVNYLLDNDEYNNRFHTPYIEFLDLNASDVDYFNVFFESGWSSTGDEYKKWSEQNNISMWIQKKYENNLARNFKIWNFLNKDFEFETYFDWDYDISMSNGTGPGGVDAEIMNIGTRGLGLRFDLEIKFSNGFSYDLKKLNEYISTEISTLTKEFENSPFFIKLKDKIINIIQSRFTNTISKLKDWKFKYVNSQWDWNKEIKDQRFNNPKNFNERMFLCQPNNLVIDNPMIFKNGMEYFKIGSVPKPTSSELMNLEIDYDKLLQKQNSTNSKETELNDFLSQDNNLRFVVEYNKNPLFVLENSVSFPDNNWQSTFKEIGKQSFIYDGSNTLNTWLGKFKNVSNKFTKVKVDPNDKENNNYYNLIDKKTKLNNFALEYDKKDNFNKWVFKYDPNNVLYYEAKPTLNENTAIDSYKINSIAHVYNTIYKQYDKTKNLNSIDDIVFLYDLYDGKRLSPLDMSYREFLSDGSNQSLGLYSGKNTNLYSDKVSLRLAVEKTQSIKPATIVVLRNYRGEIVNPGVQMSEGESALTTSDAIYDSRQTVLDNFYRQQVIPKSESEVYYKEANGKYTLIENTVSQIYFLKLDNGKTIYFLSYKDCWNYLNDYLSKYVIKALKIS